MSQSGFIAGMLLAAFIVWLAINDRLSVYTGVLWGNTAAPKPTGNISDQNGIIAPSASTGSSGPSGSSPMLPDLGGIGGGGSGGGLMGDLGQAATLLEFIP